MIKEWLEEYKPDNQDAAEQALPAVEPGTYDGRTPAGICPSLIAVSKIFGFRIKEISNQ